MADIFLSYCEEDAERAEHLVAALGNRQWNVFWDRDVPPGSTWEEVLERELYTATCLVVLWSTSSIKSAWVKEEAGEARDSDTPVFPAKLDDVKPPLGWRQIQAANLANWQPGHPDPELSGLLAAIAAVVDPMPASSTPESDGSDALSQLHTLAELFYEPSSDVASRALARDAVYRLASEIPLQNLFTLGRSAKAGERIAAGIGLLRHVTLDRSLARNHDVIDAVRRGLDDKRSRVRYRYAVLTRKHPELGRVALGSLEHLAASERNSEVKDMATKTIRAQRHLN